MKLIGKRALSSLRHLCPDTRPARRAAPLSMVKVKVYSSFLDMNRPLADQEPVTMTVNVTSWVIFSSIEICNIDALVASKSSHP